MDRKEQSLRIQYEHQHTPSSPPRYPSNNLKSAIPWRTTSQVEAWIGTGHIAVLYWPIADQMDVVPMVTLPYYLIYLSSPAKDLQKKSNTQRVRESTFNEKEERQIIREKFFSFYKKEGLLCLRKEITIAIRDKKGLMSKNRRRRVGGYKYPSPTNDLDTRGVAK